MKIFDLKHPKSWFRVDSTDILPLAFAGLAIGSLALSAIAGSFALSLSKLANQTTPTLVQQVNGRAFTVRPADHDYREPEVIRRTVSNWAVLTFTWGKLPGQREKTDLDEGKPIAGSNRIPTSAWEASFLLAPDFREAFLQKLAKDVIPQDVFSGRVAAVLVVQEVSPPAIAGDDRWQVNLIATRIVFDDANPSGAMIPFNRTVYVRAIEPPENPLIEQATEYQRIVYSMLEGGLQIEEIRPLKQEGGQ
jgi:hypothetical protein